MRRLRLVGLLIVLVASVPSRSTMQERRPVPIVPPDMLAGQRLVDRSSRFSIEAPAGWVWVWLNQNDTTNRNFSATDPAGGLGFAVNVTDVNNLEFEWTRQNAQDYQIGMAKKLIASGFQVVPTIFESTNFPVKDSYRFVWAIVMPDGNRAYRFGYIAHYQKQVFSFTCIGIEKDESPQFTRFVRSTQFFR